MNDKQIRVKLHKHLKVINSAYKDTIIIDEFDICNGLSRIDVAVINGILHGYEIKSDFDTLNRLPSQIHFYNKSFDQITITTTEKHIKNVCQMIPEWWGILLAKREGRIISLHEIRKAKENPEKELISYIKLLWKNELVQIISENNLRISKNSNRIKLSALILNELNHDIVYNYIRLLLKSRKNWRI